MAGTDTGQPAILGVRSSLTGQSWHMADADERLVQACAQRHSIPEVVARVLLARGIDIDEAPGFLNPTIRTLLPSLPPLRDMDKAVALSGAGTLYYNRGTVKLAMGDYRGAGDDFTAAIERDPRDLQAYLNRGTARYVLGDHEATLRDFQRATEIAPTYTQARMKYGVTLYELGRTREALPELRAALACAPPDWPPRAQIEAIIASIA